MDSDAEHDGVLNKQAYDIMCEFIRLLNVSEGDKVLDLGCFTGDVTNFIASLVGPSGEVVGVDDNEARIKIAKERFGNAQNMHFLFGDSSSKLPHDEEGYYDLYFSGYAFPWLTGDAKKVYLSKAYKCLKHRARLAFITSVEKKVSPNYALPEILSAEQLKKICEGHGFVNVMIENVPYATRFSTYKEFESWFRLSRHGDLKQCDPDWVKQLHEKAVSIEADGSVLF